LAVLRLMTNSILVDCWTGSGPPACLFFACWSRRQPACRLPICIHWQSDGKLKHYDYARAICREASAICNEPKLRRVLASKKTVAAVVDLALRWAPRAIGREPAAPQCVGEGLDMQAAPRTSSDHAPTGKAR